MLIPDLSFIYHEFLIVYGLKGGHDEERGIPKTD